MHNASIALDLDIIKQFVSLKEMYLNQPDPNSGMLTNANVFAKKTAEMLPFWNKSGDELSSFFPKNTGISEHFQMKLQKAENAVLHLTVECSCAR